MATLLILPGAALGQTAPEYAVKASYIARFTEFIEWPEKTIEDNPSKPIVISVIGDAPFRDIFDRTFAALKIKRKSVEIRYISSVEDSEGSQIIFISRSEKRRLKQIVAFTKDKPILTISDTQGFVGQGVMINFYQEEKKIRFEINPSAAEDAGLQLSSLLLSNAKIVHLEEDKE